MVSERKKELLKELEYLKASLDIDYPKSCIVFNDTDSVGISLYQLSDKFDPSYGVKLTDGDIVTPEGYALVAKTCEDINDLFVQWFYEETNSNNIQLNFKREKICDVGIWLKKKDKDEEAKKNYIVHVLDEEDVAHPKFKYTGVKLNRSVLPKKLKIAAKKIVEHLLITQNRQETDKLVQDFYEDFCSMSNDEKAIIQRCNNVKKWDMGAMNKFEPRAPGHVRAAINFNYILKELNLATYEPIDSGDTAKILFVEDNNKWGLTKIAYSGEWGEDLEKLFTIDNKTLFEKVIYEEIKRIYKTIDWPAFNPTQNYAFNIFDMLFED